MEIWGDLQTFTSLPARYGKHVRHALIGFASSVVADTLCNPIRVLKVNRQASLTRTSSLGLMCKKNVACWWEDAEDAMMLVKSGEDGKVMSFFFQKYKDREQSRLGSGAARIPVAFHGHRVCELRLPGSSHSDQSCLHRFTRWVDSRVLWFQTQSFVMHRA